MCYSELQYCSTVLQEVSCIFPFVGDNPGQRTGGSLHKVCPSTRKGVRWCATKVNIMMMPASCIAIW